MKKLIIASVAAITLVAAPAQAVEWIFGAGFVGAQGTGTSWSMTGNYATGFQNGGGSSEGGSLSFGEAQSGFGYGIGTLPGTTNTQGNPVAGVDASTRFGNFAGASTMTGSASQSESSVTGNGSSGNFTAGFGTAGTSLSGSGAVGGIMFP